jgi:nitrite reductase/ring-hydroxylating ferredoxin subunit
MARFPKPSEGSWTQHYPELGTGPVSYEDSISPQLYELERAAIFKRVWLNVGRVESLPRKGSYFTKELKVANTSIIVVRNTQGEVKAFHNICRHRGNKLVWNDMPLEETSGICRQFTCKYHAWRYDLDGKLAHVQQESEFFNLELEALHGRVPGVLSRTGLACEPVTDRVLQGRGRSRFRGAALPDRRPAPPGQHLGGTGLGNGPRHA